MKLSYPVTKLPLVGSYYAQKLQKLGIRTVKDLLYHVPNRYLDYRNLSKIKDLKPGETATCKGEIVFFKNQYTRTGKKMQIAKIADSTGEITVVWFNQPFLIRIFKKGTELILAGKIDWFGSTKAFISPDYEIKKEGKKSIHTARLVPIYPETQGVSSKWLRSRIDAAFNLANIPEEYLPKPVLTEFTLPDIASSIASVHFPSSLEEAKKGVRRLAFDEFLFLEIISQQRKRYWQENKSVFNLKVDKTLFNRFLKALPFKLTFSQERSIAEIDKDLKSSTPMNRLLEGDVGSGKTVVAAYACFAAFANSLQSVIMAPTQILAQQHFETLQKLFADFKIRIRLITSAGEEGDAGSADLHIGTHALIHKKVDFDNVAVCVIDEQHRFGVEQRSHLVKITGKAKSAPHVLTMTATPIPRTIALTIYGDLDLSTLDELPQGRIPVTTWIVPPVKRNAFYEWMREIIKTQKIQVYLICPLIEESEAEILSQVKSAKVEYEKIKSIYPELEVALLHGKMKSKEKNKVLSLFKKGQVDILVTTPVVEVGIDVPNASIMVIEGAERFGLAQLHQLRGRVGRGKKKSYCILLTESKSPKVHERLGALKKTLSGFELAELDLKMRGPGEIYGLTQHGFPELKIASWTDTFLLKNAKKVAQNAMDNPLKYKKLLKEAESKNIILN